MVQTKTRQAPQCRNAIRLLGIIGLIILMAPTPVAAITAPDELMDCEVYETKRFGMTVGFRVGNMLLNAGPDITFSKEQGVAWDRVSQGLIARYVELCSRYNAGLVDKQEYQQRIQDIERLHIEAEKLQAQLLQQVKDRKDQTRQRMETLLREKSGSKKSPAKEDVEHDTLVKSVEQLALRIENLKPMTTPLKLTEP